MKKNTNEKTNVMRKLESLKIPFGEHYYTATEAISGIEVANTLKQNPEQVFKTLVTTGKSANHYVFMIPVSEELDLKKAAKVVDEKAIEMLKANELLGLTGYIHGGCSPIGMKKSFQTVIHSTAAKFETIIFSGGKIGYQVEVNPKRLSEVIRFSLADIIKEDR